MQFYYGEKTFLRILDEAEFWKHQEAEHTVVIRHAVPNLEEKFVEALKQWEQALSQTQAVVVRFIETYVRSGHYVAPAIYSQVYELIRFCLTQSEQFVALLNQMGMESKAISSNIVAVTLINHIRRESEYFIGIAQTILHSSH